MNKQKLKDLFKPQLMKNKEKEIKFNGQGELDLSSLIPQKQKIVAKVLWLTLLELNLTIKTIL